GALIGRRRSSAFWGLGCPKTHHEIKDSLDEIKDSLDEIKDSLDEIKDSLGSWPVRARPSPQPAGWPYRIEHSLLASPTLYERCERRLLL
ncbi:MAG: hypothetical protein ABW170_23985, partial [Candidatus Thiodiazotropha sp. L084R]